MSTPTVNHNNHTRLREQQQQINEIQDSHLNSNNLPQAILTRSDSTATVILEEEEAEIGTHRRDLSSILPPALLSHLSTRLRSLLKTSGQFSKDSESFEKFNELFADGNELNIQRLLSEINSDDVNMDISELTRSDSNKLLDFQTLTEFLRSESFDQLIASAPNIPDALSNPSATACSTTSFSELRSVSPELTTNTIFDMQSHHLQEESDNSLLGNQTNSFNTLTPITVTSQFNSNQGALNAFEHDHAFLSKRIPTTETPTSSTSKRPSTTRDPRRTSTRLQSHAKCSTSSNNNSTQGRSPRHISRATDIKTEDDLSYYLERRRKNNEASKLSRAARKQKFGNMDQQCDEYERVNAELRMKIAALETATAILKSGLVDNFQRKSIA